MRKWIVAASVVVLAVPALAGEAVAEKRNGGNKPKRVERVIESAYSGPTIGSPSGPGALCYSPTTCPYIDVGTQERFVKVEVLDASGTATAFSLGQNTEEGPGVGTDYGFFCGTTGEDPIQLEAAGVQLVVQPFVFGDIVCPGAVGTTGTVKATLSNIP